MLKKEVIRKEIVKSNRTIQWKFVESRIDNKCLHYGRFILSPLKKGQADTIGIAMRRALLGEIKGTSITCAKFQKIKISHEYGQIVGIEEPVHEILLNLKQIVLRSFTNRIQKASICVSGPTCVTAKDISVSPFVQIVDTTQYITTLTEPIDLSIELKIERDRGYRMKHTNNSEDGSYSIDAVSMPVRTVNYTIHNCKNGNEDEEMLFLEIWTNGSLTPSEALREASKNLIELIHPFLHMEEGDVLLKEKKTTFTIPPFTFKDRTSQSKFWDWEEIESELKFWNCEEIKIEELKKYMEKKLEELKELKKQKKEIKIPWDSFFIDQLELSSRTYNCLKRYNINTVLDILNTSTEDSFKNPDFCTEELMEIFVRMGKTFDCLVILYKRSTLLNNKFLFEIL